MIPTPDEHIQSLLTIINLHRQASIAITLQNIITAWQKTYKPLNELHTSLMQTLETDIPSSGCLYTMFHRSTVRHYTQLVNDLKHCISEFQTANTELVTVPANDVLMEIDESKKIPINTDEFTQKLFLSHVAFTQSEHYEKETEECYLIQNALLTLISTHKKQMDLYETGANSKIKAMAQTRLCTMQDWLSQQGYQTFVNAVLQINAMVKRGGFDLDITTKQQQAIDTTQHLLNWLAIVYEFFLAVENPLALSHTYKILSKSNQTQTFENIRSMNHTAKLFLDFYIADDCVVEINLDFEDKKKLRSAITAILTNNGSLSPSIKNINYLKQCLIETYDELLLFFQVNDQFINAYNTLNCKLSTENAAKYKTLVNQALEIIVQAREFPDQSQERRDSDALKWYSETLNARVDRYKSDCESANGSSKKRTSSSSRRPSDRTSPGLSSRRKSREALNEMAVTSSNSNLSMTSV